MVGRRAFVTTLLFVGVFAATFYVVVTFSHIKSAAAGSPDDGRVSIAPATAVSEQGGAESQQSCGGCAERGAETKRCCSANKDAPAQDCCGSDAGGATCGTEATSSLQ